MLECNCASVHSTTAVPVPVFRCIPKAVWTVPTRVTVGYDEPPRKEQTAAVDQAVLAAEPGLVCSSPGEKDMALNRTG